MPQIDEYVKYGANGICRVAAVERLKLGPHMAPREYYILKPVHQNDAKIYVPVENETLVHRMRPVLAENQVETLLTQLRGRELAWIEDRRQRACAFQAILARRELGELVLLAGCLYRHGKAAPRGLTASDEQVLRQVEKIVEQELAFVLRRSSRSVPDYIRAHLGLAGEEET